MEKVLGGIAQFGRLPAALFLVDIGHEHIALSEARRLGITTFGMVDTNCDPNKVDFAIPANDDATKSIAIITNYIIAALSLKVWQNARLRKKKTWKNCPTDDKERKAARLQASSSSLQVEKEGRGVGGHSWARIRIRTRWSWGGQQAFRVGTRCASRQDRQADELFLN